MAKPWSEVEESEEYQTYSPLEQQEAKKAYWNEVVSRKPEFQTYDPIQQSIAQKEFFSGLPEAPRRSDYPSPSLSVDEYPMLVNRVTGEEKFANELDAIKAKAKYSATGSNSEVSPETVSGLLDYTVDVKALPARGNQRNKAITEAKKIDPTFDMKEYPARAAYVKSLKSPEGRLYRQKTSADTLFGHLDLMNEMTDRMKNAKVKPANVIINFAKEVLGDPSITNYEQAASVVDSELELLLTQVGATQEGLKHRRTLLNKNSGYKQQKEAIKTLTYIIESRMKAHEKEYKKTMGKEVGDEIISPEAREIIGRIRSNGGDSREKYNQYRASGKSIEESKRLAGL